MRLLIFLFLLFPFCASAQLDRVRFGMSEMYFLKTFPDAKRDRDAEAGWVGDTARVYGVFGNAGWKIYNDTVTAYRFASERKAGPGNKFPKVDSADVHELRVAADNLRRKFELQIGKPKLLINRPFVGDNPMGITVMYLAEWEYPDHTTVRIAVTQDLSSGNRINAPVGSVATEEYYELNVMVTHRSMFTALNYRLGMSSAELFTKYPHLKKGAHFLEYRHYVVNDSATCTGAQWYFTFSTSGTLMEFGYYAWAGNGFNARSTDAAYEKLKKKATALLKEGDVAFGTADSLNNRMTDKFVDRSSVMTPVTDTLLYCSWSEYNEEVQLYFTSMAGGTRPNPMFMVRVSYIEIP